MGANDIHGTTSLSLLIATLQAWRLGKSNDTQAFSFIIHSADVFIVHRRSQRFPALLDNPILRQPSPLWPLKTHLRDKGNCGIGIQKDILEVQRELT